MLGLWPPAPGWLTSGRGEGEVKPLETGLRTLTAILRIHIRVTTALNADRGATSTEYALMVALIAAVIGIAVTVIGVRMSDRMGGQWMP
jgi:Flp pilus assembly pilin Flp